MTEPSTWRVKRLIALVLTLALTAVAAAGCGSSSNDKSSSGTSAGSSSSAASTPGASGADPAVAKLVPADVKSKGTLTIATDPTYAPDEFIGKDGKTIVGFDPELAVALGAKMGMKVKMVNATFDSIIPGLAANKYDMAISSHNDTKERQKVVDFVDYFSAGSAFYVKSSGGPAINGLADLCGHKAAIEKGTTQADDAAAQSKKCTAAGKPAVTSLIFPDQNAANLALSSGRADVGMADTPVAGYIVKQSGGQFKVTGSQYAVAPHGIALPKGSKLTQAVLAAMKSIINDGSYGKILAKWGVADLAIKEPKINGATT